MNDSLIVVIVFSRLLHRHATQRYPHARPFGNNCANAHRIILPFFAAVGFNIEIIWFGACEVITLGGRRAALADKWKCSQDALWSWPQGTCKNKHCRPLLFPRLLHRDVRLRGVESGLGDRVHNPTQPNCCLSYCLSLLIASANKNIAYRISRRYCVAGT